MHTQGGGGGGELKQRNSGYADGHLGNWAHNKLEVDNQMQLADSLLLTRPFSIHQKFVCEKKSKHKCIFFRLKRRTCTLWRNTQKPLGRFRLSFLNKYLILIIKFRE